MSGFREPEVRRDQLVLWSQKLDDAIPVDHPVRHLAELMDSSFFAGTLTEMRLGFDLTKGRSPFDPRDLAVLYLYGMMNGIRSSRQLEQACANRLDVIWLMEYQRPDHSTIASFVGAHGKSLRRLLKDSIRVCVAAGLVKLEHVSIDGTKVEANAGRNSVRERGKLERWLGHLDKEIERLEKQWSENEARESSLFGDEVAWTPANKVSDRRRLAAMKRKQDRLKKALAMIERRQKDALGAKPKAIASSSDPESRVMKDKEGRRKPNYNTQAATDAEKGVVVAADVCDDVEDSSQLVPMVDHTESNCDQVPHKVSADSQYNTGRALKHLEERGIEGYLPDAGVSSVEEDGQSESERALRKAQEGEPLSELEWKALPKDRAKIIRRAAFRYDKQADVYRCPAGHELRYLEGNYKNDKHGKFKRRRYGGCSACETCPHRQACCHKGKSSRFLYRDEFECYRERLGKRMDTDEGRKEYELRRQTVEPRIGEIKAVLNFRRFLHRGMAAVKTEWLGVCTAVNVRIMLRHWKEVQAVL